VDVTTFLDEAGLDFDVLDHAHTERAADEAAALGVSLTEVAKTLVLTTPEGNVRAVLPASERIDLRKIGDLVGASGKKVHLATEDHLARDYAEFELGAVPPFGGKKDPVILDVRLAWRRCSHSGSSERLPPARVPRPLRSATWGSKERRSKYVARANPPPTTRPHAPHADALDVAMRVALEWSLDGQG
jgi:prolyl-tRNA editing enzyme YbaK/EbsC (Cys-tRNA(Pro) deacylase)